MNYTRVAQLSRIMNRLYRRFDVSMRCDEVLFVSRQYDEPSEDFCLLAHEFERADWKVTTLCQTERHGTLAFARALDAIVADTFEVSNANVSVARAVFEFILEKLG